MWTRVVNLYLQHAWGETCAGHCEHSRCGEGEEVADTDKVEEVGGGGENALVH